MKLITGWIMSAGLVLAGTAANAQVLAPSGAGRSHYSVVSDVGGPYAAMPREAPVTSAILPDSDDSFGAGIRIVNRCW